MSSARSSRTAAGGSGSPWPSGGSDPGEPFGPDASPSAGDAGADATADGPDDVIYPDGAEDLRACIRRLIPLPSLSAARAQARIDALARRILVEPAKATTLVDEIDAFVLDNHYAAAEGVIAALGRADAGVPVLLVLLVQPTLAPRFRGAAALSLVQPRAPWGDDPVRRFREAYTRPPVPVTDPTIADALHRALRDSAYAREAAGIEGERLIEACAGAGLLDVEMVRPILRYGGERAKYRLFAALARADGLEASVIDVVDDAWLHEPDRDLRRAGAAVLARTDRRFWDGAVRIATDATQPGALRLDALARLAPRSPLTEADVRRFEGWIPVLAAWSDAEPTIRDDQPTADIRNGPNVTSVDVPTRGRVAAVARAADVAAGGTSPILDDWARRLAEPTER